MAALETIAAAINQIDAKKESLKKAFDDLQAHSSLLSPSFSLSWSDLDRHFSSLQTSLSHRLRLLQSLPPSVEPAERVQSAVVAVAPVARPELRALCEKMDGRGLRQYIVDHSGDQEALKLELSAAIRCARDPAAMVLDAIEGFNAESVDVRRVFVLLLERLMEIDSNLTSGVRERAKRVACDWRKMISFDVRKASEALGFLHFVAAYELGSEFHVEELVDYFFLISRYKQATLLCRKIGLGDKVADLIQKLIDSGKVLLSIKFITEFHVVDQFQPVPILKSYLKDSREAAQRVREKGQNSLKAQNEATDKEIGALKAVMKVIKEHKLESEFSQENLEKCLEELEKVKAKRRRNAHLLKPQLQPVKQQLNNKPQQKQQQQRGKKRPRGPPPNNSNLTGPPPPQPQPQPQPQPLRQSLSKPEGVLPDHPGSYQVNPYGLESSNLGVVPYVDWLPGLYGSAAMSAGYSGSAVPANSQLYSSESNVNSVCYGRQTGYGGYGLPTQYHPPYFPQ